MPVKSAYEYQWDKSKLNMLYIYEYTPNNRVADLALYSKKYRVRKKNKHRVDKNMIKLMEPFCILRRYYYD